MDEFKQQPIMIGTIGGIPMTKSAALIAEVTNGVVSTDEDGDLISSTGDIVTDLVSQIADEINADSGTEQKRGDKYQIKAVTVQTSNGPVTTYNIVNMEDSTIIGTALINEYTNLYEVTLLNQEKYTVEQYTPFALPKEFDTIDSISSYFETNF